MTACLASGGRVLTPASRDATALAYEDGLVVWAGSDAPGPALFPDAERIDLAGDWVAPAFVECLTPGLDLRRVAARGAVPAALGGPAVARCTPVLVGTSGTLDEATLAALAAVGTVLLLRPLVDDLAGTDLVRIAASGVALAASSRDGGELRPWDALRALTSVAGGRGLSPRAAFTAVTRGARRAAGARDGTAGTLTPGAAATFARWRTGELAVVAADDAVQRWSTDPRSGVPPMPDLSGPDPVLRALVVDGTPAGPAE